MTNYFITTETKNRQGKYIFNDIATTDRGSLDVAIASYMTDDCIESIKILAQSPNGTSIIFEGSRK